MRNGRIVVRVSAGEASEIRRRARAHRTTAAGYLRALGVGARPGPARSVDADAWWDSLPAGRRNQVHGWLTRPSTATEPDPLQTLIDLPEQP